MRFDSYQWHDPRTGSEVSLHFGGSVMFVPRECNPSELASYMREFAEMVEQEAAELPH